jgi:hypothetical protein
LCRTLFSVSRAENRLLSNKLPRSIEIAKGF